ncbi:MAG: hypothetical protein ACYC91_20640, partial [Solirubrobacteraceae bacterium]
TTLTASRPASNASSTMSRVTTPTFPATARNPSNQTDDPLNAYAASAWGHVLGCKTFNPLVFDALRDFRLKYTNQGPEQLGTGPE